MNCLSDLPTEQSLVLWYSWSHKSFSGFESCLRLFSSTVKSQEAQWEEQHRKRLFSSYNHQPGLLTPLSKPQGHSSLTINWRIPNPTKTPAKLAPLTGKYKDNWNHHLGFTIISTLLMVPDPIHWFKETRTSFHPYTRKKPIPYFDLLSFQCQVPSN